MHCIMYNVHGDDITSSIQRPYGYDYVLSTECYKRVEQLPQYAGCIKEREKKHISKKIFGVFIFAVILAIVAYFSGCRGFKDTFFHAFMLFFVVNIYDMVVLDWGIFCHSKKLRIPDTEDMDKDYKDYLFHVKGAMKGIVIGIIVGILSGVIILLAI